MLISLSSATYLEWLRLWPGRPAVTPVEGEEAPTVDADVVRRMLLGADRGAIPLDGWITPASTRASDDTDAVGIPEKGIIGPQSETRLSDMLMDDMLAPTADTPTSPDDAGRARHRDARTMPGKNPVARRDW